MLVPTKLTVSPALLFFKENKMSKFPLRLWTGRHSCEEGIAIPTYRMKCVISQVVIKLAKEGLNRPN